MTCCRPDPVVPACKKNPRHSMLVETAPDVESTLSIRAANNLCGQNRDSLDLYLDVSMVHETD